MSSVDYRFQDYITKPYGMGLEMIRASIKAENSDDNNISLRTRIKLAGIGVSLLIPIINSLVLAIFKNAITSLGSSLKLSSFTHTPNNIQTNSARKPLRNEVRRVDPSERVLTIIPARTKFNAAVRKFKETHQVKLKKLFETDESNNEKILRKQFWSDPAISNYFSRRFEDVDFTTYHPDFTIDRENKIHNDYYEWRIYDLAEQSEQPFLPYRMHSLDDGFYTRGPLIAQHPIEFFMTENCETDDIRITEGQDIYQIRDTLKRLQLNTDRTCRFILSPDYKDDHATTLLSILERGSDRILASIMINSWSRENYFEFIKDRYELQGKRATSISDRFETDPLSETLYDEIKGMANDNVYVDTKNETGYVIDHATSWWRTLPDPIEAVVQDFEKGELKMLHTLCKDMNNQLIHQVQDGRQVPFLDASHNLQTAKNDGNCVLYTNHMIQAISTLLSESEIADQIYELALSANDGSDEEKEAAEERLVTIFRDDIKPYLPFYYNEDGTPKSEEELMEFHLRKRWEVGSMAANSEEYLREEGFLPEE